MSTRKRYISTTIPNILIRGPYSGNHLQNVAESCPEYLRLLLTKCTKNEQEVVRSFLDNVKKDITSSKKHILDNNGLFLFGKYHDTGKSVRTVAVIDSDYLQWVLGEIDLYDEDREVIEISIMRAGQK